MHEQRIHILLCSEHNFGPARRLAFGWTLLLALGLLLPQTSISARAKAGGNARSTYVPMHVEYEDYFSQGDLDQGCVGEDQSILWSVVGSLAPGESFEYTAMLPNCGVRTDTAVLTWDNSKLELSALVPPYENMDLGFTNWQPERLVVAPNVGRSAQLCSFPYASHLDDPGVITYRIRNVGNETAYNVHATGRNSNDWEYFFAGSCFNADFDGDGFSDFYEHATGELVKTFMHSDGNDPVTGVSPSSWGHASGTDLPNDEIDFLPPDFDDDNDITQADVHRMLPYLGQGTGWPLGRMDPNGGPEGGNANAGLYRRFDMNGDGYIDDSDVDIVQALVGQPVPLPEDFISPSVVWIEPTDGASIRKDQLVRFDAQPFDQRSIAALDYEVNGEVVCTRTAANSHVRSSTDHMASLNPWPCLWQVPRRGSGRTYVVRARVTDGAGNVATSEPITLQLQ
jgi:hypothetical protein